MAIIKWISLPLIGTGFAQSSAKKFWGFEDQVMGEGVEGLELPHFERFTFSLPYTQKKPQHYYKRASDRSRKSNIFL